MALVNPLSEKLVDKRCKKGYTFDRILSKKAGGTVVPAEFLERMKYFPGLDFAAFSAALEAPAVRALRINTLKTSAQRLLPLLPFRAAPLPFAENAFYAPEDKIGAHPAHHAGMLYMQDPSAISAVAAADPKNGLTVIDLCAAPGGKSTQLAAAIGKDGVLVSNEYVPARCRILQGNIERMGARNVIVTNLDTRELASFYGAAFDLVVADVPCSGEGMFRKYEVAGEEWSPAHVTACAERSREILENAAELCAAGGKLLYSTCTFSLEENEQNIDAFLTAHPDFSLLPVPEALAAVTANGVNFEGAAHDMTRCRRFYPHLSPGEGQFVALRGRRDDAAVTPATGQKKPTSLSRADEAPVRAFLADALTEAPAGNLVLWRDTVYLAPDFPIPSRGVFAAGVAIGTLQKGRIVPHHQFFSAYGSDFVRRLALSADDPRVARYLAGEEIDAPELLGNDGFTAVLFEGAPLGGGKAVAGRLKNHYPKGLRNRC